jgi:hypothetical protein
VDVLIFHVLKGLARWKIGSVGSSVFRGLQGDVGLPRMWPESCMTVALEGKISGVKEKKNQDYKSIVTSSCGK